MTRCGNSEILASRQTLSLSLCKSAIKPGRQMCYRAPELLKIPAHVTRKTDMWALGCIFYELLTGDLAFVEGSISIQDYIHSGIPLEIPVLPFEKQDCMFLADLVHDLLVLKPTERPDAASIVERLSKGPTYSVLDEWITAGEKTLLPVKLIGKGATGEIYEVLHSPLFRIPPLTATGKGLLSKTGTLNIFASPDVLMKGFCAKGRMDV